MGQKIDLPVLGKKVWTRSSRFVWVKTSVPDKWAEELASDVDFFFILQARKEMNGVDLDGKKIREDDLIKDFEWLLVFYFIFESFKNVLCEKCIKAVFELS